MLIAGAPAAIPGHQCLGAMASKFGLAKQRISCHPPPPFGAVAQLGERLTGSQEVWGSIPHGSTS